MCLRTSSLCVSRVNASATFLGLPCTIARSASEVMDFLIFLSSAVLGNFSRTPPVDLLIPLLNSSFCLLLCFFFIQFPPLNPCFVFCLYQNEVQEAGLLRTAFGLSWNDKLATDAHRMSVLEGEAREQLSAVSIASQKE